LLRSNASTKRTNFLADRARGLLGRCFGTSWYFFA